MKYDNSSTIYDILLSVVIHYCIGETDSVLILTLHTVACISASKLPSGVSKFPEIFVWLTFFYSKKILSKQLN